jgi:hypothetical protein
MPIANSPSGYAKLCCYTVKILQENNVTTSYENICVGMWLMFPKAERLQLSGFEDMPDTDFMEKLIKLRSTSKAGNYLIGGNYKGRTSEYGLPWRLTQRGKSFAREVEEALAGKVSSHINKQTLYEQHAGRRGTINYDTQINPVLSSNLYKKFEEGLILVGDETQVLPGYAISAAEICSALRIYYPSENLKQKVEQKKKALKDLLSMMESDGISTDKATAVMKFLTWLDRREVLYE